MARLKGKHMDEIKGYEGMYTVEARAALLRAKSEAVRLSSPWIRPAHILLGIIRTPGSIGRQTLETLGVDLARLLTSSDFAIKHQDMMTFGHRTASDDVPIFAEETHNVLGAAPNEVVRLGDGAIGTEHLLLALLTLAPDVAAALIRYDATLDRVRQTVDTLPHGSEHVQILPDDAEQLLSLARQLPRRVPASERWRNWIERLGRFARRFPVPTSIIAIWCAWLCAAATTVDADAHHTQSIALIARLIALGAYYLLPILFIAALVQMALPTSRQQYRDLFTQHRLVTGWVILIVFRYLVGLTVYPLGQAVAPIVGHVQGGVSVIWIAIWLVALARRTALTTKRDRSMLLTPTGDAALTRADG